MAFNIQKFQQTHFTPREVSVPVKDLAVFFAAGEDPVFKVPGLTGAELAQVNEAVSRNRSKAAIVEGLLSKEQSKQVEAMREILGIGETVPDDLAKRLEMLVLGSVDPKIDNPTAVRLAEAYPVEFYSVTNTITELTGLGQTPGKPKPSSGSRKSSSRSNSAT
jgi:hypothetical protein